LLRGGDLGELSPRWAGWRLLGGQLMTPAGVTFGAHEFAWWSLTCLQARSWQRAFDRAAPRLSAGDDLRPAVPVVDGRALDLMPASEPGGVAADGLPGAAASIRTRQTAVASMGTALGCRDARQRGAAP